MKRAFLNKNMIRYFWIVGKSVESVSGYGFWRPNSKILFK